MGGYTSSSVATIPEDQFCCQCGCCPMTRVPGFGSVVVTDGILELSPTQIDTPDGQFDPATSTGSVPLTGRFYFESIGTLELNFPGGLDTEDAGGIGVYLRVPEAVETCTPAMVGRSVFNPVVPADQEAYSWDPIQVQGTVAARPDDGFGVLLGLTDVTRVDQITLTFASDDPGQVCIELLGYALLQLDPEQVGVQDLLVAESRLEHDAGADAAEWQPSASLGPLAGSIQASEDASAIDGVSSLLVSGFVSDPVEFVAVDRAFSPPLDLTAAKLLRLWIYTDPNQAGGEFLLEVEDANGAAHTFQPIAVGNGWQELTYDLTAAWTQGANIAQIVRLTVGITGLSTGQTQSFRLDTVRAANLVDPEDRTRQLLGLPPEPDAIDQLDAMEQPADWTPYEDPQGADPTGTTSIALDAGVFAEGSGSLEVSSSIAVGSYGIDRQLAPPLDLSERNTLRVAVRPSHAGLPLRAELEDAAGGRYVSPVVPAAGALVFEDLDFDIDGIGGHIDARAVVRIGLRVVSAGIAPTAFHADDLRASEERTLAAGFHFVLPAVQQLDPLDTIGARWNLFDPFGEAGLFEEGGFLVEGAGSLRIETGPSSRNGNLLQLQGDFFATPLDLSDADALVLHVAGADVIPGDQVTVFLVDGTFAAAQFPPQQVPSGAFAALQFDLADLSGPIDATNVINVQLRFGVQPLISGLPPVLWVDDLGKLLSSGGSP